MQAVDNFKIFLGIIFLFHSMENIISMRILMEICTNWLTWPSLILTTGGVTMNQGLPHYSMKVQWSMKIFVANDRLTNVSHLTLSNQGLSCMCLHVQCRCWNFHLAILQLKIRHLNLIVERFINILYIVLYRKGVSMYVHSLHLSIHLGMNLNMNEFKVQFREMEALIKLGWEALYKVNIIIFCCTDLTLIFHSDNITILKFTL